MYQYETYDLEELLTNPDLDPDGDPQVLYAVAQCWRQGKGTQPDARIAREVLERAAQAGSQKAAEELTAEMAASAPVPERDYASLGMGELNRLAERNDLGACLAMYEKSQRQKDAEAAAHYLRRCVALAGDGEQPQTLRQRAFVAAGVYYRGDAPARSRYFLEQAKELESPAACRLLLEYYRQGIGGPVSMELADGCVRLLRGKGAAEDLYQCALRCLEEGRLIQAGILLDEALERPDCSPELNAQIRQAQKALEEEPDCGKESL